MSRSMRARRTWALKPPDACRLPGDGHPEDVAAKILAMRVIAPHQLAIAGNLAVSIDGQDAGAKAFTTSVPAGIVALFAFEDAALEAARNGKDLKFAAKSITSQDFSFSFSLAGFSAALAKLRQ